MRRYDAGELVLGLADNDDCVGVVLVGTIFAVSHGQGDIKKPKLLFKCVEGTILFHPDSDNGVTSHPETWLLAYEPCEVIYLSRKHFQKMWNSQRMMTKEQILISSL